MHILGFFFFCCEKAKKLKILRVEGEGVLVPLQLGDNSFREIKADSESFEVALVKERSSGKLEIRSRLIPSPAPRRVMIRVQSSPSLPS